MVWYTQLCDLKALWIFLLYAMKVKKTTHLLETKKMQQLHNIDHIAALYLIIWNRGSVLAKAGGLSGQIHVSLPVG